MAANAPRRVATTPSSLSGYLAGKVAATRVIVLIAIAITYASARDILRDINANVAIYRDCTPEKLGDEGRRWEYTAAPTPDLARETVAAGAPGTAAP